VKRLRLIPAVILVLVAGCGSLPNSPARSRITYSEPVFGSRDSVFTDDQLRAAVYSNYRCPAGCYQETGYRVAPYYVNALSISPPNAQPASDWRDLATEDTAQARAWAESTVSHGSGIAHLDPGPPAVTNRYIEFAPTAGSSPFSPAMRVHRLSYLNPLNFRPWSFYSDSLVGTFNARPVDTTSVRGLAEYLWFKWYREIAGFKVLSSFGSEDGSLVVHTIYDVETSYGDYNLSDDITLHRLEFRTSKSTGEIVFRQALMRHVVGRRN
jgi:hypothetical protein